MEELKVELLKIGKKNGDTGDTELQKEWINKFLDTALLLYLTPEAVLSFTPLDIRALYILWHREYMRTGSIEACAEMVLSHIDLSMEPRLLPAKKSTDPKITSIFERNS